MSPIRSSARLLRNGCTAVVVRREPVVQRPVIAVIMSGEPWIAVRCMWWSTPRTPPSSSPPPARPGPPWTSIGSGEPWPVDSAGVVAVEDQDPAVPRRDAERRPCARPSGSWVASEPTRLPLAARRELDRLVERVVGEHRAHRAERLDVVRLDRPAPGPQQDRVEERAALGVAVDQLDAVGVAVHDLGGGAQRLDALRTSSRWSRLASAPIRTSGWAGLPTVTFASRARDRLDDRRPRWPRARWRGGSRCTSGRP